MCGRVLAVVNYSPQDTFLPHSLYVYNYRDIKCDSVYVDGCNWLLEARITHLGVPTNGHVVTDLSFDL